MTDNNRTMFELIVAALLGMAVITIPVALDPDARQYEAAFLPFIKNGVEGLKTYSLLLLFVLGFFLGLFGKSSVWLIGPATLLLFPIWSLIDIIMSGGRGHNLLPIEWLIYALLSMLGLVGAVIGRTVKKRKKVII